MAPFVTLALALGIMFTPKAMARVRHAALDFLRHDHSSKYGLLREAGRVHIYCLVTSIDYTFFLKERFHQFAVCLDRVEVFAYPGL